MGWRLRLLVVAALLGCVGAFWLANWLAEQPHLNARWHADAEGRIELLGSELAPLKSRRGQVLTGLVGLDSTEIALDAQALQRSARWLIDDSARERHQRMQEQWAEALSQPSIGLRFGDGSLVELPTQRRGFGGLGAMFWLFSGIALALYLAAMVVVLARPSARSLLYAVMSLCQVGNLVLFAIESTPDLGLPRPLAGWDMQARMALDLVTGAAAVHAASLYPHGNVAARRIALACWAAVGATIGLAMLGRLDHLWWWTQAGVALLCAVAIALLSWAHRREPHPLANQLRRIGVVALCIWLLLTLSLTVADRLPSSSLSIVGLL